MNAETQKIMEIPRCGSEKPEVVPPDILKGAFQSSRWKNKNIPYIILDYPSYLDKNKVDELMLKAFSEWGQHIDRSFRQVMSSSEALINITFTYTPSMTDMDQNIILAQAKYPIFGGGIQFSSLQNWTTDSRETNRPSLYKVALHEIGHSLGLLHSSYPNSIMTPYLIYTENVQLHNNDKQRIKFVYNIDGVQSGPNLTNQLLHSWRVPSLCSLTKFDAIIAKSGSEIYVFNDDQFWLLEGWTNYIVFTQQYPMSISERWKELPSHIDAAYVHLNGELYFFKGPQCWKYVEGNKLKDGYPRSISDEFPGIPSDIDAAMPWQDNHTYFFKGSRWKSDTLTYKVVQYSRKINRRTVNYLLKKSFSMWSKYMNTRFIRKYRGNADIHIGFYNGDHNDGSPFDGEGGVLAHAFFPIYGGDVHFDNTERWDNERITSFHYIALHEIGHSLGLEHSRVKKAVMFPQYYGYVKNLQLHPDDVAGIRKLYPRN